MVDSNHNPIISRADGNFVEMHSKYCLQDVNISFFPVSTSPLNCTPLLFLCYYIMSKFCNSHRV